MFGPVGPPSSRKHWKHSKEVVKVYGAWSIGSKFPRMILDNGCQRNVAGKKWHREVQKRLKLLGLKPVRRDVQEDFQFGDDRVETSICSWDYPTGIHEHNGVLNIAEIESNCPGLMSRETMDDLDLILKMREKKYDMLALGVSDYLHEVSKSNNALVRIDWFGEGEISPEYLWTDPELRVRKGTAKRLRGAATMITDLVDATLDSQGSLRTCLPGEPEDSCCGPEPLTDAETDVPEQHDVLQSECEETDWEDGVCCITGLKLTTSVPSIVEVCSSSLRLTSIAKSRGWKALPGISLESGFDLTTKSGADAAWKELYKCKPDVIACAWPCDPWCSWMNLVETEGKSKEEKVLHRRRVHRRLTRFLADVIAWQVSRGRYYIGENPVASKSWNLPEFIT